MTKVNKGKPVTAEPAAPVDNSQVLPNKEANLFKQILKFYETKQYKKGVKAADQILKKYPNHGETLAMKGLTLNCLGKKDEARVLVKKGVALNLKSHVSWHVYGLIYRSDHQYDDAIKCYQNALRIDPENLQILKDLSLLQIQRRQIEGFQETRRKILVLKSNNKNNWMAFAVGNHLAKNHANALSVIDAYHNSVKDQPESLSRYERSEMALYTNMVIEEKGDPAATLAHLLQNESVILDKLLLKEKRANLNLRLGDLKAAEKEFMELILLQPECYSYHVGLTTTLGLLPDSNGKVREDQERGLLKLYKELWQMQPKAAAHRRLPLNLLSGEEFATLADSYLQVNLRKGVPSLFKDLSSLYTDGEKTRVIGSLVEGYISNLKQSLRFTPSQEPDSEVGSALVWSYYYLAHHYDHTKQWSVALKLVEEAIEHTPTNIDFYVLKARIYKHSGDMESAHYWLDYARQLDTADRYLNTKCVRYAFRANQPQLAADTVSLFLREGDTISSLSDMQVMWYELAAADCWIKAKEYGKALKQLLSVEKHYEDFREDQFDFHTYCLRKMTLRAYVHMLRWEDSIKSHRFFVRATRALVDTYVRLYDAPRLRLMADRAANEGLSEEEKKKLQKQKKRQAAKAAAKEEPKDKKVEKDRYGKPREVDEDPNGEKLASIENPLLQAARVVKEMRLYSPNKVSTQVAGLEVYSRLNKPLLVVRGLVGLGKLAPEHPLLHLHSILLFHSLKGVKLHPVAESVINSFRKGNAYGEEGACLKSINDSYISKHKHSLPHLLAGAKALMVLEADKGVGKVSEILSSALILDPTLPECEEALEWAGSERVGTEALKAAYHSRFPLCPSFFSPPQLQAHAAALAALKQPPA